MRINTGFGNARRYPGHPQGVPGSYRIACGAIEPSRARGQRNDVDRYQKRGADAAPTSALSMFYGEFLAG